MTKVLVTGGAGFIGSHVVDKLIENGHEVTIIDNLSTGKKENINPKAKFFNLDITNLNEELNDIFEKERPEVVMHMAAQVMLRRSLDFPLEDAKINILGTINILELCKKYSVKKFIYTSTGGARVGEPLYFPVDEKHPLNPISPYGISKHSAEHYVEMYGKLHGIDYLTLCFGNVYGPRDNIMFKRLTTIFMNQILQNKTPTIFGDGNQTRDFIYVKDLAEFIVSSFNKSPITKLFHLADGKQISVNEVFSIIKKVSGFEQEPNYIDAIPGEVRDIYLDTNLAQKELNWSPKTSFETGLRETFDWFKNNIEKL